MERHDAAFERMATLVPLLPQALKLVTSRAAERALQAKIKAGMAGVRELHAQHLRQQAEAARDGQARVVVETWEGLIRAHHAALPGIEADPGLKGTREQLLGFAHGLTLHPELVHTLTTRGPALGMENRPNLARVLADPSPERAMTALLDGIEAGQRAKLKAVADRKAELEARLRPRRSPSPSPW